MERKDTWSNAEDMQLVNTVLETVKNGGSQSQAFGKASKDLGRTKASCGFRWNKTLRSEYEENLAYAFEAGREVRAKKDEPNQDEQEAQATETHAENDSTKADDDSAVQALERLQEIVSEYKRMQQHVETLNEKVASLQAENQELRETNDEFLRVVDAARRQMTGLNEYRNESFRMDKNGNLEKDGSHANV